MARGMSGRLRPLLGVLLVLALVLAARAGRDHLAGFIESLRGLGAWGPVLFVLAYVVSALILFPSALLTLGAGAVFGFARGVPLVLLGSTLAASAAFLVARHLARDAVARRIARDPRFVAIDRAVEGQGLRIVLLLRLSPLLPFVLLNYALGVTRVRFRDFLLGSVGMVPAALAYTWYGAVAGTLALASPGAAAAAPPSALRHGLLALGVIATILVTWVISRLAGRAMREATGHGQK